MAEFRAHKIVAGLPATLEPSSLYLVRVGAGFDFYATNESGTVVAYSLNQPDVSTKVTGTAVTAIVALTQAEYDALATKSATTLYVIK